MRLSNHGEGGYWSILQILQNIWNLLSGNLHALWEVARKYLGTKWAVLLVFIGLVYDIIFNIDGLIISLVSYIVNELVIPNFDLVPPAAIMQALQIANTFFPLTEFFGFLTSYAAVVVVLTIYRWAKSYVPTISST